MRFLALACDYDGTLAHHGRVDDETLAALERFMATGRKLILVTGRELNELLTVFPGIHLFEWVVAENGALLYRPRTRDKKLFGEPAPETFIQRLHELGVGPVSVGHVIVATWHPHETTVLEVIRAMGLDLQVIFNKGAVMVLPASVNKATGLKAALQELDLSPHEVVGVGDAENDHAFLSLCECSVAVANALPAVQERVDLVTQRDHGAGVVELIDRLIENDLNDLDYRLTRHHLLFGHRPDGTEIRIPPYGLNILIAGPSGSGKSSTCTSLLEQFAQGLYQYCVIDPEGDYEGLAGAVTLGSAQASPPVDEILQVLKDASTNTIVELLASPLADRPAAFLTLLPRLQEMRARTGRPHWIIIDEAHHLLPTSWVPGQLALPRELKRMVFVTVHPDQVSAAVLSTVDVVVAVGQAPERTVEAFCKALGAVPPRAPEGNGEPGEVLVWPRYAGQNPFIVRPLPSRTERRRHTRKYAEGELSAENSFYFRGPDDKLNLRAQNLFFFLQLADGVDDDTWLHHLRRRDYSRWFRERIKDEELANEAAKIEVRQDVEPAESRKLIRAAIERYYTLPATTPAVVPTVDVASRPG
jgi:hydroxymethylpyrimidine pyrophosphatase-like HAD family hydrolase